MKNKNSLLLLLAGIAITLALILSGCSTEDPWNPNPSDELFLSFVSGPSDTVAYGSNVSFSWTSRGGTGEVLYRYRLGGGTWSTASNETSVNLPNRTAGAVFDVDASDGAQTVTVSREFFVGSAEGADTTPPDVWIDSAPSEGSYIATGSNITFSWDGNDAGGDEDNILFWWSFAGTTSDTSSTRSVSFDNVTAANPAEFMVWAIDQSDNASDPVVASFIIRDANILYIDDYQWMTAAGDVDRLKERDQKQFYRNALEGYAFAEWDIAVQGFPDSADLVTAGTPNYTTIVFASDSDVGSSDGTWWFEIGLPAAGPLHYYMEQGGNLLATGALIMPDVWNSGNPPSAGDFEYDWLGVSDQPSTVISSVDTLWWIADTSYTSPVVGPDSITIDITYFDTAWENEWWFTWAIADGGTTLNLPDSMKLDVAKNGNQDDYASAVISLRDDSVVRTEVLFNWGLWVDGDPPSAPYYMNPVGHICRFTSGTQWTAMLNFDTYAMPLSLIKQTFGAILTEFGE